MPDPSLDHLNALSRDAKERHRRRDTLVSIDAVISLALTHMSVPEVKDILEKKIEFLREFG